MDQIDVDVDDLIDDGLWEPQREIQYMYETKIAPELDKESKESYVSISLTRDEFEKLCSFIEMFAYN